MPHPLYDLPLTAIDGSPTSLRAHAGQVLLIVNVASKCGLTPQYAGLEKLYADYRERGFVVLGFPANDFAGQEPGSDSEIQSFCTSLYGIDFPLYSKIAVTGPDKHPLYAWLTAAQPLTEDRAVMEEQLRGYKMEPTPAPEVLWNFEKFLVDRTGKVVRRFAPDTLPEAEKLIAAIEQELARP